MKPVNPCVGCKFVKRDWYTWFSTFGTVSTYKFANCRHPSSLAFMPKVGVYCKTQKLYDCINGSLRQPKKG